MITCENYKTKINRITNTKSEGIIEGMGTVGGAETRDHSRLFGDLWWRNN
jgi:hypothetical protein